MAGTKDTLFRQWLLLRQIPRYPRKLTAKALSEHLADAGHAVETVSFQARTAEELSGQAVRVSGQTVNVLETEFKNTEATLGRIQQRL